MVDRPFLSVDIGNSDVKAAVWDGSWSGVQRAPSALEPEGGWPAFIRRLTHDDPFAAGIASVVPELEAVIGSAIRAEGFEAVVVKGTMEVPARVAPFHTEYHTPDTLGADRLAAAAAAFTHYGRPAGRAVLAIDAGTAITLDAVTRDGVHLGGAIIPGPASLIRSLTRGTAQLPTVDWRRPDRAIGRTSAEAIQSGLARLLQNGLAGLVADTLSELPGGALVVGTGGWARQLADQLPFDAIDELLVLEGIRLLAGGPDGEVVRW